MVKLWDTHTLSAIKEEMADWHDKDQHCNGAKGKKPVHATEFHLSEAEEMHSVVTGVRPIIAEVKGDRKEQKGRTQHREKCGEAGNGCEH